MKLCPVSMLCAPILAQKAALEALENGDQDVVEMRRAYRRRRNIMVKGFETAGIPCSSPKGAFYTFPYVGDFGMSSHEFAIRLLEEENVACVPGTAFGPCGEGFVRCCYATATDEIQEALTRINRFVKRLV